MATCSLFGKSKYRNGDIVTITEGNRNGKIALVGRYLGDNTYSIICEGERIDGINECSMKHAPDEIWFAYEDMLMFSSLIEHLPPEEYKEQLDDYMWGYMPEKYSEEAIGIAASLLLSANTDNCAAKEGPVRLDISELEDIHISILENH